MSLFPVLDDARIRGGERHVKNLRRGHNDPVCGVADFHQNVLCGHRTMGDLLFNPARGFLDAGANGILGQLDAFTIQTDPALAVDPPSYAGR